MLCPYLYPHRRLHSRLRWARSPRRDGVLSVRDKHAFHLQAIENLSFSFSPHGFIQCTGTYFVNLIVTQRVSHISKNEPVKVEVYCERALQPVGTPSHYNRPCINHSAVQRSAEQSAPRLDTSVRIGSHGLQLTLYGRDAQPEGKSSMLVARLRRQ